MVDVAVEKSSYGNTNKQINTAVSSALLEMRPQAVSKPIAKRQKRRRRGKADANTLLAIAQSALARLNDVGIGVYVDNWEGEWESGVVITLTGVRSKDKRLSIRKG